MQSFAPSPVSTRWALAGSKGGLAWVAQSPRDKGEVGTGTRDHRGGAALEEQGDGSRSDWELWGELGGCCRAHTPACPCSPPGELDQRPSPTRSHPGGSQGPGSLKEEFMAAGLPWCEGWKLKSMQRPGKGAWAPSGKQINAS